MAGEKENTTQVLDEKDDFDFGTPGEKTGDESIEKETEKVIAEEKPAKIEKVEKVEKKEEKKEKAAAATEKSKVAEQSSKEKSTEQVAAQTEEEKAKAAKTAETETEEEPDIFFPKTTDDKDKKNTVSFKNIAKRVDLELEDDSEDEFVLKVSDKIEKSKQEIALDKFTPDAQRIIKHLNENGGKIDDFFKNTKINSLQGIIGLDPATKITTVRAQELIKDGMESNEAYEQAQTEVADLTAKELRQAAQNVDEDAQGLIDKEISTVVSDREKFAEKEKAKALVSTNVEIKQIKNLVEKQADYLGIKLTADAKKSILADIDSGVFDAIANKDKPRSKFNAYMMSKFGTSIYNKFKTTISEKSREGYNEALDKSTAALHKTKAEAQREITGRLKSETGEKKNFDTWDDALFETK